MSWTLLDDQHPVARKRHRCDLCGRWIEPGEKYRRIRAITDDGPTVWKECQHCGAARQRIWSIENPHDWDEGIDLGEYLREYRIEPLLTLFRRHWRPEGGQIGERIPVSDLPLDALDVMRPKPVTT